MTRQTQVSVFKIENFCGIDGEEPPTNLARFIEWAQAVFEQVPPEYRESAKIEIHSVGSGYDEGEHYVEIDIYYWRSETDEEKRVREIERDRWKEREIAHLQSRIEALRDGTNFWLKEKTS